MTILKFIRWWWLSFESYQRWIMVVGLWTILFFPNLYLFGLLALPIYFGGVLGIVFLFLLNHLRLSVLGKWEEYQNEINRETDAVVARLRGDEEPKSVLNRLRARRVLTK